MLILNSEYDLRGCFVPAWLLCGLHGGACDVHEVFCVVLMMFWHHEIVQVSLWTMFGRQY